MTCKLTPPAILFLASFLPFIFLTIASIQTFMYSPTLDWFLSISHRSSSSPSPDPMRKNITSCCCTMSTTQRSSDSERERVKQGGRKNDESDHHHQQQQPAAESSSGKQIETSRQSRNDVVSDKPSSAVVKENVRSSSTMGESGHQVPTMEDTGRERLKRHRVEVAGQVWIPDIWGKEELMKDWIDCSVFDAAVVNNSIMSAREALVEEGRRAHSTRLRIENSC